MSGIVSDLIKAIRDLKNDVASKNGEVLKTIDDASGGSVTNALFSKVESAAKRAKRSILNFPIIVSDSIDPKISHAIAQGYQFNCAEYVKVMIANDNIVSATSPASIEAAKRNIISRLRGGSLGEATIQNGINNYLKANITQLCEALDAPPSNVFGKPAYGAVAVLNEAVQVKMTRNNFRTNAFQDAFDSMEQGDADEVVRKLRKIMGDASTDSVFMQEIKKGDLAKMNTALKSAGLRNDLSDPGFFSVGSNRDDVFAAAANFHKQKEKAKAKASDTNKSSNSKEDTKKFLRNRSSGQVVTPPPRQTDYTRRVEVKSVASAAKDNSYQPVMLDLTLSLMMNDVEVKTNLVVGVRTTTHRLSAEDMVNSIAKSFGSNSLVFSLLRCTSGELSFLKDFLFGIKDIKEQIAGSSKATNLLAKLKRQITWNNRNSNAIYREVSKNALVPPTATIVLSSDEVQNIRSLTGFDLSKSATAKKFLETFNLMGIMLVDQSIGVIRIYEEGDGDFNLVSLDEMSRRGKGDNTMRDMLTLMARN